MRNPFYNSLGLPRKVVTSLHLRWPRHSPRFKPSDGYFTCPDSKEFIHYSRCYECEKYQVWKEGDVRRCWHDYVLLKPADPYPPLGVAASHDNDEFLREFEQEKVELARQAEELAEKSSDDRSDDFYWLNDDYEDDEEDKENDGSAQPDEDEEEEH
jgi:hypothetical protein